MLNIDMQYLCLQAGRLGIVHALNKTQALLFWATAFIDILSRGEGEQGQRKAAAEESMDIHLATLKFSLRLALHWGYDYNFKAILL